MRQYMAVLLGSIIGALTYADSITEKGVRMSDSVMNSEKTASPLLLEMTFTPARGGQGRKHGLRVYQSGLYESLSDQKIVVDVTGKSTFQAVPLVWRPVFTFSVAELAQVQEVVRQTNVPKLLSRYSPTGQVFDAGTQTWQFWLNSKTYTVAIEGYPANTVPALLTLEQRLQSIHKWPHASTWRALVQGKIIERNVNCEARGVPTLRPVVDALFPGGQEAPASTVGASQTVLLEVIWKTEGQVVEETRVLEDGRRIGKFPNSAEQGFSMNPAAFQRLRSAIQAVDWVNLVNPLCQ